MSPETPHMIRMHDNDNVAIIANHGGLATGAVLADGTVLLEPVPQGHKVALADLAINDPVYRYNVIIGHARQNLPRGSWVNEHRLDMPEAPGLDDLPVATEGVVQPALEGYVFDGFRNPDGSVGTRNILAISTSVQCVSGVVDHAVRKIREQLLPKYPNVDNVIALEHVYGCGVAINAPDAVIPIRSLRNIARNPNFGGQAMVVSLGCEKLQPDLLFPKATIPIRDSRQHADLQDVDVICLQDDEHVGFQSMIDSIVNVADKKLQILNRRRREPCPASALVVGVQCGGSDAFSGVSANPLVGFAADLLVRAGAKVMFSEVTEVRDGIAQLTARAANQDVADALIREMDWYDRYLGRGLADRSANTSPGNKKGGLSNIVEKAMGSIIKSGSSPIVGVVSPGDLCERPGLNFAATPASDFVCGTLQLAAGMTLHLFTTGRGTPYGLKEVPVIKLATRSDLARRWHDLMDVNAGRIVDGDATIEEMGWELFHLMLDIASGRKQSKAEALGLHNSLALFNPAPVT
ncbi:galactarate dehydratase [Candidimonas sp. SYP-B2681]|uniref:galactarate dehydratase n=1 Tax=Candidimonas sp. SYP-B2681 TaxID=2497686 RepID=UPI000F885633|nr:galactarate dehydratase [Candidimonas sp. SYP-B2681]RTZ41573.1 galactarate dehydratase [Candidimonas sp. SYP-B2681]